MNTPMSVKELLASLFKAAANVGHSVDHLLNNGISETEYNTYIQQHHKYKNQLSTYFLPQLKCIFEMANGMKLQQTDTTLSEYYIIPGYYLLSLSECIDIYEDLMDVVEEVELGWDD